jgi:acyl-CoA synthetase (AMP-forming)/AMP-acid ligase II
MNVVEHLLAAGAADAPAVLFADKTVAYGELRANVDRLARALLSSGLTKGDRVGLWSENNPFFVTAYLGIIRAGLIVVPFQTDISQETFSRISRDAGIKALLVSKRHAARIKQCWVNGRSTITLNFLLYSLNATWPRSCLRPAPPVFRKVSW